MDLDDVSACAFCSLAPDQPTHCFNHSSASDACPGRGPRARNRARPHRPDRVDVARVLARVPGWEHQLGGVTVTDRPVRCPHGQVEDRPLVALGIFAVIGTVRRITETGRGWKFAQLGSRPRKGLALIAAPPLPPSDGPARPLGLRWAAGTPAFLSPARSPGGCADDLRSPCLYPAPRNLGRI